MNEPERMEVQYIEIKRLSGHCDNPRRDMGDLTELAASIAENGIKQPLTVVPWFTKITGDITYNDNQKTDPLYTIVIGHRRYNAAKQAGLKHLPCIVSDMDYKTQLSTMLEENMQRADLNLYEQVKGIEQLSILGADVNEVSRKTGLSQTTVKKRLYDVLESLGYEISTNERAYLDGTHEMYAETNPEDVDNDEDECEDHDDCGKDEDWEDEDWEEDDEEDEE